MPAPEAAPAGTADEEAAAAHTRYDVKKAFGAIARIHSARSEVTERQQQRLAAFMRRYIARTTRSKDYTTEHRPHLADPAGTLHAAAEQGYKEMPWPKQYQGGKTQLERNLERAAQLALNA